MHLDLCISLFYNKSERVFIFAPVKKGESAMQKPKEEIRCAILQAAEQEFFQEGFRSSSMRRIAAKAGISPGNIYGYFSGKTELFEAVVRPAIDGVKEALRTPYRSQYQGVLRDVSRQIAATFNENRIPILILAYHADGSPYEGLEGVLSREIARRVYRELLPNLPAEKHSRLLANMVGQALLRGILEMFATPREQQEMEQALESFLELMCGMLGNKTEKTDDISMPGDERVVIDELCGIKGCI